MKLASASVLVLVVSLFTAGAATSNGLVLVPQPRNVELQGESVTLQAGLSIWLAQGEPQTLERAGEIVRVALAATGLEWNLAAAGTPVGERSGATLSIAPEAVGHAQGYELEVSGDEIRITGHDAAGLFYGAMTLKQLLRQCKHGQLPLLRIEDYPAFEKRGYMLDISRDRIPTMETLFEIVDQMAALKLNELQLYTEHAFAYEGHEAVWRDYTPMTPDQVRELDAYCRARYVDFVPNQNTFAHMERWLKYEPYSQLKESRTTLAPLDPGSIALVEDMLDQLLPLFSADRANVGCDEAVEVGEGRSKAIVAERGFDTVYFEYLMKVNDIVKNHEMRMQFWADMVVNHAGLIPKLPKDSIPMLWYYEDEHPYFQDNCPVLGESGLDFYVCPGTGTWVTLLGRTKNCMINLWEAAHYGSESDAMGYLICNWGNFGFFEHLSISSLPLTYGAAVSWAPDQNQHLDLPRALDLHVFHDEAGVMGQLAYDLGNAYLETGIYVQDTAPLGALPYFVAMHPEFTTLWYRDGALTQEACQKVIDYLDAALPRLSKTEMEGPLAAQIRAEFENDTLLLRHSSKLGKALVATSSLRIEDIPEDQRAALAADLAPLINQTREVWLARHRTGGMDVAMGVLNTLLDRYNATSSTSPE